MDHEVPSSVGIRLRSPEGTLINLLPPYSNVVGNPKDYFDLGANAFYGEGMAGSWTIQFIDYVSDNVSGTLKTWGIEVYGN